MMHLRATVITCAFAVASTALADDTAADEAPEFQQVEYFDIDAAYERASRLAQRGSVTRAREAFIEIAGHEPEDLPTLQNIVGLSEHLDEWADCVVWSQRLLYVSGPDEDFEAQRDACVAELSGSVGTIGLTVVTPEYAPVAFNGMVLADGPVESITLPAGTWAITADVTDWEPFSQTVELATDEHVDVSVELGEMTFYGSVALTVDQPGASIVVDGEPVGLSPLSEPLRLPVGRYLVEVHLDGFYPWRRYVDIYRDVDDTTDVQLIDESVDLDDL